MGPLQLLLMVLLANLACLMLIFYLRTRARRLEAQHHAFVAAWRPVLMRWSLGKPVPLPLTAGESLRHLERFWLLQLWNDLHQSLRGDAAERLNGLLKATGIDARLPALLASRNPGERLAAVQALGHLKDAGAWQALVRLALDADSMLAFHALRALLVISAEAALPVLIEVLRSHRDWSRARLLGTLRRIPSPRLVEPLGTAMLTALDQQDTDLARDLALLLGALRFPATRPYLRELLLRGPSPQLLDIAAEILGEMRDAAALPALEMLVTYPDVGVRKQAVRAIGLMAGPAQIPALLTALEDEDWWVIYSGVEALHRVPGIRPEKLAELYSHPRPRVRDAMQYYQETVNLDARPD